MGWRRRGWGFRPFEALHILRLLMRGRRLWLGGFLVLVGK
jgi:hypothetical protein